MGIREWLNGVGGRTGVQPLRPHRSQKKAFPDLLEYAALIAPGVVLTKGGSLLGGFYFRGRDLTSSTASERNYVTSRINAALARLGSGWVSWIDAIRLPAPAYPSPSRSHFPDAITSLIDEERRQAFDREGSHFESEYALVLQYTPPRLTEQKLGEMMFDDDARPKVDPGAASHANVTRFESVLSDVADYLGDALRLRRMAAVEISVGDKTILRDELVTYLHYCVTGLLQPVNIPPVAMYLDALIGRYECWPGNTPRIDGRYVGVVSIGGFPQELYPNILDALDHMTIPYRWSSRMIYLDAHQAHAELKHYRRKWKQRERGFFAQVFKTNGGMVDEDAGAMVRELEGAITDSSSGLVGFGFYTPVVIVHAESRHQAEEWTRTIQSTIRQLGFSARIEGINAMDAFHGSLPGHGFANVRRPLIHTLNLADLVPSSSVWAGSAVNPCPFFPPASPPLLHASTSGATPFRLNLHVGDLGHTLVLGPTGAGKSTLLATIAAQFRRYPNATVIAFDKGRSLLPLALAVGANHYDLAGEGDNTGLCPLQYLETESDASWAEEWLGMLYELQAQAPPSPRMRGEIHRAIGQMRESRQSRSMTDFLSTVQDADVRAALLPYTLQGQLGRLLDEETDGLRDSPFSIFELEELLQLGDKNVIPVLLVLFRRIEKMLKGQPTLLILDEAWVMLGHPVFRGKIREWLKTMRKLNCSVVLATQSLSDAASSGIFDVLLESCPTKILLPNDEADKTGSAVHAGPSDLYRMMGLNSTEIAILKTAQRKRHYYYTSPEGRRLFDLNLGPIALAFCAVSDKPSLARIKLLEEQFGDGWPFVWLEEKGVDYAKYLGFSAAA